MAEEDVETIPSMLSEPQRRLDILEVAKQYTLHLPIVQAQQAGRSDAVGTNLLLCDAALVLQPREGEASCVDLEVGRNLVDQCCRVPS